MPALRCPRADRASYAEDSKATLPSASSCISMRRPVSEFSRSWSITISELAQIRFANPAEKSAQLYDRPSTNKMSNPE